MQKRLKKGQKVYLAFYTNNYWVGYIEKVDKNKWNSRIKTYTIKFEDGQEIEMDEQHIDGKYDSYSNTLFTTKDKLIKSIEKKINGYKDDIQTQIVLLEKLKNEK